MTRHESKSDTEIYDEWLTRVTIDWRELKNVPEHLRDERVCMTALTADGDAFQYFPNEYFNDDFYPRAVGTHGYALRHVPEASRTRALCLLAANHRTSISFIPEALRDREMVTAVVRNNPPQIKNVPPRSLDAMLLAEYAATGNAFDLKRFCDGSAISLEQVALMVVARGLDAVGKLPGYAVTEAVYNVAEQRFSWSEYQREWQRTKMRHNPAYLEAKVPRVVLEELAQDPEASRRHYAQIFYDAWAVFWDDAFLMRMIEKVDSSIIASAPEALLSESVCFAAVSRAGDSLRFVPFELRTLPVCLEAVHRDRAAITFVPANMREQVKSYL
ncbi:MAG: hypothetical protein R3174_08240 [Gammaproteobacteria bacterium]|nr:hypothetical protein [Gammaproteobacteria bacterium]